jgi:predicted RNase H-like nuclease (RuvC/YqgF family)
MGAFVCFGMAGCLHVQQSSEPAASPADRSTEQTREVESLRQTVASKDEEILVLEKEVVALNMKILEYEAVISDLQDRFSVLQQRLDAAIIEVVRTKARLRSFESKAEAASTIAEAEIAVKALKNGLASADAGVKEEVAAAEYLLKMSVREFNGRNYGGALYLANQSKGQVRTFQLRRSGGAEKAPVQDEKRFARPLHLKVLTNSNLRSGPGLDNDVVGKLGKDALVTGLSYSGRWVRVKTARGVVGWLFYPLVGPR